MILVSGPDRESPYHRRRTVIPKCQAATTPTLSRSKCSCTKRAWGGISFDSRIYKGTPPPEVGRPGSGSSVPPGAAPVPIPAGSDIGSAGGVAGFPSARVRVDDSEFGFDRVEVDSLRPLRRRLDSDRWRPSAGATSTLIAGPEDELEVVAAGLVDRSGSGSGAEVDVDSGAAVVPGFNAPGIFSARPDFCSRRAAFSASSPPNLGPT